MDENTRMWVAAGAGAIIGAAMAVAVAVPWALRTVAQSPGLMGSRDLAGSTERVVQVSQSGAEADGGFTYLLSADGATLWVIKDSTQWATVWRLKDGRAEQVADQSIKRLQ